MKFSIIVAATTTNGIGYQDRLPWHIPEDLMYFFSLTTTERYPGEENTLIMGRKTWYSLPKRPLPRRRNIVVSSSLIPGVETVSSLACALQQVSSGKIFVIGGGQLFAEALNHPDCTKVYLTQITNDILCDVFLPDHWLSRFVLIHTTTLRHHQDYSYAFQTYRRTPHPEERYLDLLRKVLYEGSDRTDRSGVGTRSLFGEKITFDLRQGFPLITTKKVFWKGIVCELLFFIRGQTQALILDAQGVKIWNGHSSAEYLQSRGINRSAGDLGPIYGYQWRHWGATYPSREGGIDQLQNVINDLKNDPYSRRHLVSAWNVGDLSAMALPPCHVLFQFYVSSESSGKGVLSCQVYQRSADLGLGLPFNIASYSLLTMMVAQVTGLQPGVVTLILGDAHIYLSHISGLQEQLTRSPYPWPQVSLNPLKKNIDDFEVEDITLENYRYHPGIALTMAI